MERIDPDNARFAKLLKKHRTKLLTFLYVEGLEPTNNLAEREIRPEVVVRKISGGPSMKDSDRGANAHAVLGSLIRPSRKDQRQGRSFLAVAGELLRGRVPSAISLVMPRPAEPPVNLAMDRIIPKRASPSAEG